MCIPLSILGQNNVIGKEAFLTGNRFTLTKNDSQAPVFSQAVNKYQVFLASEIHHKKGNYELRLNLIRELHRIGKLDLFLLEGGYSYGLLVNTYLTTGNSELLDLISYNEEQESFYRELYKFNNSIDKEQRIKAVGIDVEGNAYITIKWLEQIIPENKPPEELADAVRKLKQISDQGFYEKNEVEKCLSYLFECFSAYPDQARFYLRDQYDDFNKVMHGFQIAQEMGKQNKQEADEVREQFLYEMVLKLLQEHPTKSLFGHFGEVHVPGSYQKEWSIRSDWNSFAARLNSIQNSPVKGKVCSILTYYPKWKLDLYFYVGLTKEESKLLKKYSKGEKLTLFSLEGKYSPFYHLLDKYQYIIVNRY